MQEYLIDIIATYLLIPGRADATMRCDSQELCCRTIAGRYCIRSRDGYIIAAGRNPGDRVPIFVRPVTTAGRHLF
jgi:hypothetical protein